MASIPSCVLVYSNVCTVGMYCGSLSCEANSIHTVFELFDVCCVCHSSTANILVRCQSAHCLGTGKHAGHTNYTRSLPTAAQAATVVVQSSVARVLA